MAMRFIRVPNTVFTKDEYPVMIGDWRYYVRYETDITNWMDRHLTGWTRRGMLLGFSSDEDRTAFMLTWQAEENA